MTEQHKSGPWVYEDYSMDGKLFVVPEDYIGTICSIEARGRHFIANARLIAAAPELLEALEVFVAHEVDYMERNCLGDPEEQQRVIYARAAIAKAKGEA